MKQRQLIPWQSIFRMQNSIFVLLDFSNELPCVRIKLKYETIEHGGSQRFQRSVEYGRN